MISAVERRICDYIGKKQHTINREVAYNSMIRYGVCIYINNFYYTQHSNECLSSYGLNSKHYAMHMIKMERELVKRHNVQMKHLDRNCFNESQSLINYLCKNLNSVKQQNIISTLITLGYLHVLCHKEFSEGEFRDGVGRITGMGETTFEFYNPMRCKRVEDEAKYWKWVEDEAKSWAKKNQVQAGKKNTYAVYFDLMYNSEKKYNCIEKYMKANGFFRNSNIPDIGSNSNIPYADQINKPGFHCCPCKHLHASS